MKKECPFCGEEYYEAHMFGHVLECGRLSEDLRSLIRELRGRDGGTPAVYRYDAAIALGQRGDPAAIPVLIEALKEDEDEDVRYKAAEALGKIGNPAAIPVLIDALKDESFYVRKYAISSLGEIGDPAAISVLSDVLKNKSPHPDLRREAAEALGEIGDLSAIPVLIDMLKDEDSYVRYHVAISLGLIRESAVSSLGKRDPAAIPALIDALNDDKDAAIPALVGVLNDDKDPSVRYMAAWSLGRIGHLRPMLSLRALKDALEDEDEVVRDYAASALKKIKAQRVHDGRLKRIQGLEDEDEDQYPLEDEDEDQGRSRPYPW